MSNTAASGVANFISVLQSQKDERAAVALDEPSLRLLRLLQKTSLLPLSDVVSGTGLRADVVVPAVAALRARGLVELVEAKDSRDRFLRLTPLGFDQATTARQR